MGVVSSGSAFFGLGGVQIGRGTCHESATYRSGRVWGAHHCQPGCRWLALLEQELGKGCRLCHFTPYQPRPQHHRPSYISTVQVSSHLRSQVDMWAARLLTIRASLSHEPGGPSKWWTVGEIWSPLVPAGVLHLAAVTSHLAPHSPSMSSPTLPRDHSGSQMAVLPAQEGQGPWAPLTLTCSQWGPPSDG